MLTQIAPFLKGDSIITIQVGLADPEHIFVTVHPHRGEFLPVRLFGTPEELDDATNADITFDARDVVETAAVEPRAQAPSKPPLPPEPEVERLRAQLKALEGQPA